MRKRSIALLLCAALLLALAGCGSPRPQTRADGREREQSAPQTGAEALPPIAGAPEQPRSAEASFPLLARPFSDAESEAMANHNARRCALLVVNYYYCRCLYSDGSSALVRYEIVDNNLRHRSILTPDCPADFLCESEGRLYYLNADGLPESVGTDGGGRRVELDAPCRSLQLHDGALYCLLADGTLLALRGGEKEALLAGCAWAFVSEQGVFYTAASDGRAHLFDPETRTDVTLTAEAALCPTLIGTTLFYAADEADGRHLRALELSDGTQRRMAQAFRGELEFLRGWDGGWQLRLSGLGGAAGQQTLALAAAFDGAPDAQSVPGGFFRLCRGLGDGLRTDELFSPDGAALGFELVLPGGGAYTSLAADNPPEK